MVSNLQDGWGTLCHQLSKFTKHGFYSFRLDEENKKDVMNSFDYVGYTDKLKKIRVVYSMTDPRWKFYQVGEMLWFENESYYNNRIIRKRINKYILTEYCNKLSLNITDEDFWNIKGDKILFSRKYS
ncbi:hypothetical protein C7M51_00300 [Mixta intestinalis]|uniref:Uncharacterized protein n=2 Tax=Mixta intestinalis TaxID=1615494 RepID=A0A6P1PUA6_9GAMM|nr:hypothetical protein C7M51_00300 [Mixta intestinalis]